MDGLKKVRLTAEEAVKDMQDGPMKVKAFEVILNKLLDEGSTDTRRRSIKNKRDYQPNRKKVGVGEHRTLPSTDLDKLRGLIQFQDRVDANDGVLFIAEALEKTGVDKFSKSDIETNYKALVRGGATKLPIVKDYIA